MKLFEEGEILKHQARKLRTVKEIRGIVKSIDFVPKLED